MSEPRFSKSEIWHKISTLHNDGTLFYSVVRKNRYRISALNQRNRKYSVMFESGNTSSIPLEDLYAAYHELYHLGWMPRGYLKAKPNGLRIFGQTRYSHAPGATIYAILPALDDAIRVEKDGDLFIGSWLRNFSTPETQRLAQMLSILPMRSYSIWVVNSVEGAFHVDEKTAFFKAHGSESSAIFFYRSFKEYLATKICNLDGENHPDKFDADRIDWVDLFHY